MSKRKSQNASKSVDMVFEDDEDEQAGSVASTSDSVKKSRVSGRAKKVKTIYDPSLTNGPVHKRKKEALEALEKLNKSTEGKISAKPKLEVKPTIPTEVVKSPVKVRPAIPAKVKPVLEFQSSKPDLKKVVAVPVAKEPSKRIQERKPTQKTNDFKETSTLGGQAYSQFLSKRLDSASGNSSEDYEKPTLPRAIAALPDVKTWTSLNVYDHFVGKLNFSKQDCARIFIEEEIDGEALILLKRNDIVTEKFSKLKLGTALKIWTKIQQIQTRSTDPSQSWK